MDVLDAYRRSPDRYLWNLVLKLFEISHRRFISNICIWPSATIGTFYIFAKLDSQYSPEKVDISLSIIPDEIHSRKTTVLNSYV